MDLGKIDLLVYFLGYISIKKVAAKPQISLIALSRMYVRAVVTYVFSLYSLLRNKRFFVWLQKSGFMSSTT
jgi:hypothetical protein